MPALTHRLLRAFCLAVFASCGSLPLLAHDAPADAVWDALILADDNGRPSIRDQDFYPDRVVPESAEEAYRRAVAAVSPEAICRFPARYRHLAKQGALPAAPDFHRCAALQDFLAEVDTGRVAFVRASASVASPMSYFGHTALKFPREEIHFARTVSFLAVMEEHGAAPGRVMVRGAIGAITGQYVVAPWHHALESYVERQQRGLAVHELALDDEGRERMLFHLYELYEHTLDYNFFADNCATRLFALLQVAEPTLRNTAAHTPFVSPDSMEKSLEEAGLIIESRYTHPRAHDLFRVYWEASPAERRALRAYLGAGEAERDAFDETDAGVFARAMTIPIYRMAFRAYNDPPADYAQTLARRPEPLPAPETAIAEPAARPPSFHLGYRSAPSRTVTVRLAPGLYDRREATGPAMVEQTFRYLDASGSVADATPRLDDLRLLEVESFTRRSPVAVPASWRLTMGASREFDPPAGSLRADLRGGYGGAWGTPRLVGYALGQVAAFAGKGIYPGVFAGAAWRGEAVRVELEAKHYLPIQGERPASRRTVGLYVEPWQRVAIRASYDQARDVVALSLILRPNMGHIWTPPRMQVVR